MRLKPCLINSDLLTQAVAGAGDWGDLMLRLAGGYTLQESRRLNTGLKFLNGPWNLYRFCRVSDLAR
jgi:hypothetical protein